MGQVVPDAVEQYLSSLNHQTDAVLEDMARIGDEQHLPLVDAEVGVLLRVLATSVQARRILEIGTAIGYSGIWLAGALPPEGVLLTIEQDEARARQARDNFARAGLSERVSIIIGDAQLMLPTIEGPFDLIFQDGDKQTYGPMLDHLVGLLRPAGLLITDNVLWNGEVVPGFVKEPRRNTENGRAIAAYNERLTTHPGLLTSIVPLRDGVAISVKR